MANKGKDLVYADTQLSRFDPSFVQLAVVMDNRDPQKTGKLKVWILNSQSDKDAKESWITASYLSPFAGRTPGIPGADSYEQFPKSYGFWAVTPDVGNTVAVFFANGKIHNCYWFACAYDDKMNTMVPGSATAPMSDSGYDLPVPVTDYDRNTVTTDVQQKYMNVPLVEGLKKQNLLYDTEKGVPNRSSTRQIASTVYGLSSPRGNNLIIDDGYTDAELNAPSWDDDKDGYQNTQVNNPVNDTKVGARKNEGIVLRTRSGAQFLLSESEGSVFLINRDGTARFEMTPDGNVVLHAAKSISIRAEEDLNLIAGRNINIEAGADLNASIQGNTKLNLVGSLDTKVGGQVVINTGADLRLVSAGDLRAQAGGSIDLKSAAKTAIQAGESVNVIGASGVFLSGGGKHLTVNGKVTSDSILQAPDFQTPTVGLNSHIHYHAQFTDARDHSDAMAPPQNGGGTGSTTAPSEAKPADDVAPVMPEAQEVETVMHINSTAEVSQVLEQDLPPVDVYAESGGDNALTYVQSFEGLQMLMPCTGQIREKGYWGRNVPTESGTTTNRNGWIIQCRGNVVAPEAGTVTVLPNKGIIIQHRSGYKSIFYNLKVADNVFTKALVKKGQVIGQSENKFNFEIRMGTAAIFGFAGTVDPGLFYTKVTGVGENAGGKSLEEGKPTNPLAKPPLSQGYSQDSTDLVVMQRSSSISSVMPQRGSKNQPRRVKRSQSSVQNPGEAIPEYDTAGIDKTLGGWRVKSTDPELIQTTIKYEGPIPYQKSRGMYRNGRFYTYMDSRGFPTIGYGHLIKSGENFSGGIDEATAERILSEDLVIAVRGAKNIYRAYSLNTPYAAQMVLVEMVFQMGEAKVKGFRKMLGYLQDGNYNGAAAEMINSDWHRQTPGRAQDMARIIRACG